MGHERKAEKRKRELNGDIKCGRCPYNRGENAKRKAKPDKHKNIDRETIRGSIAISEFTCSYCGTEWGNAKPRDGYGYDDCPTCGRTMMGYSE